MNIPTEAPKRFARLPKAEGKIERSAHRGTTFSLRFDISPLIDDAGGPLVHGEELEHILLWQCVSIVQDTLREARKKVPNHP